MKHNRLHISFLLIVLLWSGVSRPLNASDSLKTHFRVVAATYDPFVSMKDSTITGFEKDLLDLICTINNWTYDVKMVPFYELLTAIENDSADLAIGAIYVTEDRQRRVKFSTGYFSTGLTIVSGSKIPVHMVNELGGLKVGVKSETTGFRFAKNLISNEGYELTLIPYYSTEETFEALKNNELDVLLNDYSNSYYLTLKKYPGLFHLSDNIIEKNEIAFPVSSSFAANLEKINRDLTTLEASGIILNLQRKWLLQEPRIISKPNPLYLVLIIAGITLFVMLLFLGIRKYVSITEAKKHMREKLLLSHALEHSVDIIIITDQDNVVRYINPSSEFLFDMSSSEMIGKKNQFFDRSQINPADKLQLDNAIKNNSSWRGTISIRHSNGRFVTYDVKVSPFSDEMFADMIIVIASDITKITSIEDELAKSVERYKSLIRQSSEGIYIFDPETLQIQEANNRFLEMTGYTDNEILKLKTSDLVVDETGSLLDNIKKIALSDETVVVERKYKRKDGSFIDVGVKGSLIKFGSNSVVLVNVRDISERKKMIESLRNSEELYRKLINESPVGIVVTDEKGNITKVNKAVLEILGSPSENATLQFNMLTLPTLIKAGITHYYEDTLKNKTNVNVETDYTSVWGKTSKINFQIVPLLDDKDNVAGTLTIAEDITERKVREEQIRESEEKYRSMFENMAEGFYQVDADGKLITVNTALVRMLGYDSIEELQSIDLEHDVYVSSSERAQVRQQAYQLNMKSYTEVFWKKKDGSQIIVSINERIVWDKNRNFKYFEATIIDISELKRAESERKNLEEQLIQSQKLESLGTLAGGIAHDFNNVLSMIMMSSESMKFLVEGTPELMKYADIISSSAERGAGIAKQLLLFARSEKVDLQPISLTHIINEVIELIQHSFPKSIEIKTDFQATNGIIMGNSGHLQQVIMNLSINARDAMVTSGINFGNLIFRTRTLDRTELIEKYQNLDYGRYVCLTIEDNGCGMSEDVIQRMFEPFFTTKSRGKGTGLGLSIVHGIIQSHHGFIDVSSAISKGTIFSIFFPAVEQEEQSDEGDLAVLRSSGRETILIVDDEDLLRETMNDVLTSAGYTVIQAKHGIQAIEIYDEYKDSIDAVVTDLGMPYMDGEELFKNLKQQNPDILVIVSTGYLEKTSRQDMLDRGVKDVILKPYRIKDLLEIIRRVLDTAKK